MSVFCCRALQAAINVGRLCKHISEHSLLHVVNVPFNIMQKNERRSLLITCTHVIKTYFYMDKKARQNLIKFYRATAGVEYLEHALSMQQKDDKLILQLQPVGLERKPKTVHEAKVSGHPAFLGVS